MRAPTAGGRVGVDIDDGPSPFVDGPRRAVPDRPVSAPRRARLRRRALIPVALGLVAVAYVVVPAAIEIVLGRRPSVGEQRTTAIPVLAADDQGALQQVADAWAASDDRRPVVLTYHDIAESSPSRFSLTPAQFAAQMAALDELHANVISAADFSAFTRGTTLPPRSVMISFDDGARGLWKYADRILEQHHFRAVGFIITGFVGTHAPYYLNWAEIDRLARSGRWEFEAHTHLGHVQLPVKPDGQVGSFLGNLLWSPKTGYETVEAYRARVEADLATCVDTLHRHQLGAAGLFAFPYSDYGQPGNNPVVPQQLNAIAREHFTAVFNDNATPLPLRGPFQFNRLSAVSDTTMAAFAANLAGMVRLRSATP